ncbi:MAG: efflux RND transporter periplasmic adaptor subunit, partial [Desulfobulbales bacterium]
MRTILVTVLIIVIAAVAFVAGDRYGKDQNSGAARDTERRILYYTDPMNPGFRSEQPGTAPCGMPLEPVYAEVGADGEQIVTSGGPPQSPGAVQVNSSRQQLIGVRVSPAETAPMTYALRLYGRIVPDETKIYRINASTDSWVRELSDITTGSIVGRDQLLAEVLAPAFYNAQVTYLVAMDNLDRIREQLGDQVRHQQSLIADNQIRMAVQNLQNLGITDAQIEELANKRQAQPYLQVRSPADGVVLNRNITLYQWFRAGEEFYEIANLGRVWVYAD